MELGIWLAQHGGIAHSQQALRAGFTRYSIRQSIAGGECERIRRDWLALPTAPTDLRAAAALGGRVACLSVARRLELWHLADEMNHVSLPRNATVPAANTLRVHWSAGPIPVARFALVEPIENAGRVGARRFWPGDAARVPAGRQWHPGQPAGPA